MGDPLRLYGLNALVTNAVGGVGEAIARTLIKHGATVVALDKLNSGVQQHFKSVKGITGVAGDYLDAEQLPGLVAGAADLLGGLDILVNDYPISNDELIAEADDRFAALLQTRASLATTACRAALPYLKRSPAGRIINVGMLRSCFTADASSVSVDAELDLASLTQIMAADIGEFSINASYVQPGAVMTPESRKAFRKETGLRDHCINHSASRRIGEPVDIAKVVLFLASDDSVFVSGTGVAVDGGRLSG